MEMINMGLVPKTANLADILNHKYEIPSEKKITEPVEENTEGFFTTNPQLQENFKEPPFEEVEKKKE